MQNDTRSITKNSLVRYIRNPGKKDPRGVLVAVPLDDLHYSVGFAFCHQQDQFLKHRGLEIAANRATRGTDAKPPLSIMKQYNRELEKFLVRCARYYQGKTRWNPENK